jgi:hypothetical protein
MVESVKADPWWWSFPGDPIRSDFRNFLYLVWEHLNLPPPDPAQVEIAYFLQHGWAGYANDDNDGIVHYHDWSIDEPVHLQRLREPDPRGRSDILEAFRGVGKSYITAAIALWWLYRDPVDTKILVVSASGSKASEFVTQAKNILLTMDLLESLRPKTGQRDKVHEFDVAGASLSQSPSLKARGITGQITGSRATHVVADDIEVPDNSSTEDARLKLLHKVNEFEAIKVSGYSEVLFLGTPQTEESIYNRLIKERGYWCYCWPARFPALEKLGSYELTRDDGTIASILAPFIRQVRANPTLVGQPTNPERFDDYALLGREAKGKAFFALQYQLDTSLSDAERYPLKQHDLMVMACNTDKAPRTVQWGHESQNKNRRPDIPNFGFSGDYWLAPLFIDQEWRPFEQSVLFVDPSGRGKDETAWAVVKTLNGIFYVVAVGGFSGDPATAMRQIAVAAKLHNVNEVTVEPNMAGTVWIQAFTPILLEVWSTGCSVTEAKWSKNQKEIRIIETVEPIITLHKVVVDERVARDQKLMYQLTHITRDRGALTHDDRIDAVAGAIAHFTDAMSLDAEKSAKAQQAAELDAWLEDLAETARLNRTVPVRTGRNKSQTIFSGRIGDYDADDDQDTDWNIRVGLTLH